MSAFRKAVLAVAPERLEQFTTEMKKNINEKGTRKRHSKKESSSGKNSSGHSKSTKRRKHSTHDDLKKVTSDSKSSHGKKSGSSRRKSLERKKSPKPRSKDRKHRRKSPTGRKERQKNLKDDSDFDPKDLDLSIPVLPLSEIAKDRKLMLDTAFSIVEGPRLTSMLPDILKLTPIHEIKQLCEEQLSVMSTKRVLHVLAGTEMQSSSGTDSSDEERIKAMKKTITQSKPNDKETEAGHHSHQDHSLQANLVDSTTSDHQPGPSMLFPSAVTTARTTAKKSSSSTIPLRQIENNSKEEDDVSTSTEPNFIYTKETTVDKNHSSSDTEEGEVQTSELESDSDVEDNHDSSPVEQRLPPPPDIVEGTEEPQDVLDVHPSDDVLVEVEEIEEHVSEDIADSGDNEGPQAEEEVEAVNQPKGTKPHSGIAVTTNNATSITVTQPDTGGTTNGQSNCRSGKTRLEILELELRARAIKSLMNAAKAGMLKSSDKK